MATDKAADKAADKSVGERVPTGIKGFDGLIEGGFEKNSVNLLKGGSGTGKTIFGLQFLYKGFADYKEPGIFISFAESKEAIFQTGKRFNWDFEGMEKKNNFGFVRYSPHEIDKILKEGGGTVKDEVDAIGAKRVVIDSLTAYSFFFRTPYETNEGILELFEMLKSWKCTSLVTDEQNVDPHRLDDNSSRLGFLTDGLIHTYYLRRDSGRFRALEIVKMRHTHHSDRLSLFKMEKDGIGVYPEVGIFSGTKKLRMEE